MRKQERMVTIEEIRKKNEELLEGFMRQMEDAGLSQQTRFAHGRMVALYINHYLQSYVPTEAHNGWSSLDGFYRRWLPIKVRRFGSSTINQSIGGIRKFYHYLAGKGLVSQKELQMMEKSILENRVFWVQASLYESRSTNAVQGRAKLS